MLRQSSRASAGARTYPLGALTTALKGEALAEIETLYETGCVAFMQTGSLPHDNGVMLQAMRYAKTFDLPLWLRPVEDTLKAGDDLAALLEMAQEDEDLAAEVPPELDRLERELEDLETRALLSGPLDAARERLMNELRPLTARKALAEEPAR